MTILAILAALATVPMDPFIVAESLDVAEVNAVYRPDFSERQFTEDQFIWRRDEQILGWQWRKESSIQHHPNRVYVSDGRRVRILRPLAIWQTESNFDRESIEREWLPECKRKGLAK